MKFNDQIYLKTNNAKQINNFTYVDYYCRLMLLARTVFEWKNLPNGINEKWIEKYLFFDGGCMFFFDEKLGFTVARCAENALSNYYDDPLRLRPISPNGFSFSSYSYENYLGRDTKKSAKRQAVLIQNNDALLPTNYTISLYAHRLAEIQRTIDVNINAQKTPYFVKCEHRVLQTVKNLFAKMKNNDEVIFGDKAIDSEAVTVIPTVAPAVFPQLQIQKHALWNEAMTFIGVNNANMDKRERLVAGEVQANNEQIELSAHVFLKSREKACELINKLFPDLPEPVSVRMRTQAEIKTILKEGE